ncbi:MAG: universal stress protein [Nitrospirae bacterium]|nr:universal stress protein [Nitrospirota bacterium]
MANKVCPIMERLERLLVATDGSKYSEGAVREAINLAKTCGSKLFVVSVIEVNPEFEALAPGLVEKEEKQRGEHLKAVKAKAEKEGVDCEIILYRGGEPYESIVDEAAKNKVGMIVMGRYGRTGISRIMMGSTTEKVIGYTLCRVMVVPKDAKLAFDKILIATDGSMHSEFAANEAITIAKRSGSTLIILSVAKKDENLPVAKESVDAVKKVAEKEEIKVKTIIRKGVPHEVIVKTAAQENVALIVIGSHGRTGITKMLMGSVAERVIGHAESAVLVWKL